jgi:hypothetical protein
MSRRTANGNPLNERVLEGRVRSGSKGDFGRPPLRRKERTHAWPAALRQHRALALHTFPERDARARLFNLRASSVLVRTVLIESVGRYQNPFANNPPSIFAQYSERVPMVRGRLDRKASTATGYTWLV